jgi:hypothetical protein
MSRSYRKTALVGWSSRVSERKFKTEYNRRTRSNVNNIINTFHHEELDDIHFPTKLIEMGDVWDSKMDGPKIYFGGHKYNKQSGFSPYYDEDYEEFVKECQDYYKKYMRK